MIPQGYVLWFESTSASQNQPTNQGKTTMATTKLKKPTPKKHEFLDYYECEKYIQQKHFAGKAFPREFWLWLVEDAGLSNDSQFWILGSESAPNSEVKKIADLFLKEFGEGPYWVSW